MAKKQAIEFAEKAPAPRAGETKFGGQPDWIAQPQWPLSRSTGKPMRFICQIRLDRAVFPHARGEMAYVFMTDDEEDYVDGTWEPEGGENCVVVQPGGAVPGVKTAAHATGPTLQAEDEEAPAAEGREYGVSLTLQAEPDFEPEGVRADWSDDTFDEYADALDGNKVGGSPIFLQGDEFPAGDGWRLLLQLDSTRVPFYVNFGDAGIAYAFINEEGTTGKLLWQCA